MLMLYDDYKTDNANLVLAEVTIIANLLSSKKRNLKSYRQLNMPFILYVFDWTAFLQQSQL